jgi:hypothetical protein
MRKNKNSNKNLDDSPGGHRVHGGKKGDSEICDKSISLCLQLRFVSLTLVSLLRICAHHPTIR